MAEISYHLVFKIKALLFTGSREIEDFDIKVIPNCNLLITLEVFLFLTVLFVPLLRIA